MLDGSIMHKECADTIALSPTATEEELTAAGIDDGEEGLQSQSDGDMPGPEQRKGVKKSAHKSRKDAKNRKDVSGKRSKTERREQSTGDSSATELSPWVEYETSAGEV